MHRNLLKVFALLLLSGIMLSACQKSVREPGVSTQSQSDMSISNNGNKIRIQSIVSGFGEEHFAYNEDGLLHRWDVDSYGGYFLHEYDEDGNLAKASLYNTDDILQLYIMFFYQNKDIYREEWYDGTSNELIDEVFYTFNNRGLVTRSESFMQGYYTLNSWSVEGNLLETLVYFGGELAFAISYTYDHHYKNPSSAKPGVTYEYPFINGFYSRGKWYSTSQKVTVWENGEPIVLSDQDPLKTIVEVGPQNYVSATDFFENGSQEFVHFEFTYENYGSNKQHGQAITQSSFQQKLKKLMSRTSVRTMKQQINELKSMK